MMRSLLLLAISAAALCGCASSSVTNARTDALENRQSRMDARAEARAERRTIRSDAADARSQMMFDAL